MLCLWGRKRHPRRNFLGQLAAASGGRVLTTDGRRAWQTAQAAVGGASMTPEDIQIINLSGDVKLLEEQLATATARIAELEAWIDAVPTGS